MAHNLDADLVQQRLGQGPRRGPRSRFPGARPLEDVAGVGEAVLHHPRQVRVAGPGLGEHVAGWLALRRHDPLPLGPLRVADDDGDGAAERPPEPHPAEQFQGVPLDLHAGAAAEPQPPPGQFVGDALGRDGDARRQPLDDDREGRPVRLPGGEIPNHRLSLLAVRLAHF